MLTLPTPTGYMAVFSLPRYKVKMRLAVLIRIRSVISFFSGGSFTASLSLWFAHCFRSFFNAYIPVFCIVTTGLSLFFYNFVPSCNDIGKYRQNRQYDCRFFDSPHLFTPISTYRLSTFFIYYIVYSKKVAKPIGWQ